MDKPVMTIELANNIVEESNKIIRNLNEEGYELPRYVILGIAIIAISLYTGQPVTFDIDK